jgi:glyoxylase-like metal-dependent hydrolase (beta-lactamase superfamily II)
MTGRGNNTWLLDGVEPTLIDAGVGVPEHIDAIAAALGDRPLRRVIVTHGHADHSSGVPALRVRWPDAEICRSEFADEARLSGSSLVSEGNLVLAGDRPLTVLYTPGHAIDHICLWDEAARDLYAGDMVVRGSTVMIPAMRGGGLRAYMSSLERLAALKPVRIYPGHGPVIEDPLEVIAEYLAHRRMRDEQVAACLRDGIADPDAIVSRIYPDLAPGLHQAARATVEAHLQKLREDGLQSANHGS